jgi:hypothetical protein
MVQSAKFKFLETRRYALIESVSHGSLKWYGHGVYQATKALPPRFGKWQGFPCPCFLTEDGQEVFALECVWILPDKFQAVKKKAVGAKGEVALVEPGHMPRIYGNSATKAMPQKPRAKCVNLQLTNSSKIPGVDDLALSLLTPAWVFLEELGVRGICGAASSRLVDRVKVFRNIYLWHEGGFNKDSLASGFETAGVCSKSEALRDLDLIWRVLDGSLDSKCPFQSVAA